MKPIGTLFVAFILVCLFAGYRIDVQIGSGINPVRFDHSYKGIIKAVQNEANTSESDTLNAVLPEGRLVSNYGTSGLDRIPIVRFDGSRDS